MRWRDFSSFCGRTKWFRTFSTWARHLPNNQATHTLLLWVQNTKAHRSIDLHHQNGTMSYCSVCGWQRNANIVASVKLNSHFMSHVERKAIRIREISILAFNHDGRFWAMRWRWQILRPDGKLALFMAASFARALSGENWWWWINSKLFSLICARFDKRIRVHEVIVDKAYNTNIVITLKFKRFVGMTFSSHV